MSELTNGIPVYGPCVAPMPGRRWSTIYPMRKSTYDKFGSEAAEQVATFALYDMIPPEFQVDEEFPLEFTHVDQYVQITGDPAMCMVQVIATLKRKENGNA